MNPINQYTPKKSLSIPKVILLQTFTFVMIFIFGLNSLNLFAQSHDQPSDNLEILSTKPSHKKPVIVVIGENQYTELTDFIVPYGILKRSDIAEVYAVAENKGKLDMFPALSIEINTSLDDFDNLHPEGSDLVIVPAIHNAENKTIIHWIQNQYERGATIVGICDGVWTLGYAGLLKNKHATGHWYSKEKLSNVFSDTIWIRNKRYVQDKNIITTTGVTASIPVSLALVESIAGTKKAKEMATELGVTHWDAHHNSEGFYLDWQQYITAAKNLIFFWNYERIGISMYEGMDEISLALVADAYSRTYRSKTVAITNGNRPVLTKSGIKFVSEMEEGEKIQIHSQIEIPKQKKAFDQLVHTLVEIEKKFGRTTKRFVATQIELPID
ncbi:DJ-1/PfpI family protein [Leptospira vanthielii]|nr:DJ-1/PfpI family protein [Leptospira vanthielii]